MEQAIFFSQFIFTRSYINLTIDCALDMNELTSASLSKTPAEVETSEQLKYLCYYI